MSRDIRVTIAEAFLRLCENKAPNKITVKEIVEEADVSRQSFYNYFPYREDLYIWIYEWHGRLYQMTPLETDSLKLMFKNRT